MLVDASSTSGRTREPRLARLMTETVAWRRHRKGSVDELASASSQDLANRVELLSGAM